MYTKEDIANRLIKVFPEKMSALTKHYNDYGELLGHIFFSEEINVPLFELLKNNLESNKIEMYCRFIEEMWKYGDSDVINIVDVTILESLSDNREVWINFGSYISQDFKAYINNDVLANNILMSHVQRLPE